MSESKTTKENLKIIYRWLARYYDKEAEQAVFDLEKEIDDLETKIGSLQYDLKE